MTDCVQFFNAEGAFVEKFTASVPQYKVVWGVDRSCTLYRLTRECVYEKVHCGEFFDCFFAMLKDSHRVNAKRYKLNWTHRHDLDGATNEKELTRKPMYCTISGEPCFTLAVAVWKVAYEGDDIYTVSRHLEGNVWVKVYSDHLFACKRFVQDPASAVHERLIELYRCNARLGLYKFVAECHRNNTTSTFGWVPMAEVVEQAINYTRSWTQRAIRIGTDFIAPGGKKTTLPRPAGTSFDWNVTQLQHLCRLHKEEVEFLVRKGHISPVMIGDEICGVVRDYLEDPELHLMNEFRASRDQNEG